VKIVQGKGEGMSGKGACVCACVRNAEGSVQGKLSKEAEKREGKANYRGRGSEGNRIATRI